MSAELMCAETQPHLHVQLVLKLYDVKENVRSCVWKIIIQADRTQMTI